MTPTTLTHEEIAQYQSQSPEDGQARSEGVVRRGKEIYETSLRSQLEPENIGKFLVIETTTGEYEIIETRNALTQRLYELGPGFTRYIMWIGMPAMTKRGGASFRLTAPIHRNGTGG